MTARTKSARAEAQELFLGRGPVVGVGVKDEEGKELVFLLEEKSPGLEREISAWAARSHVGVSFLVSNPRVEAV